MDEQSKVRVVRANGNDNTGASYEKRISTAELFEEFYRKLIDELTEEDLGPGGELDWGEDVGRADFAPQPF